MPRNADAIGSITTLLSAGVRLQPLFLTARVEQPTPAHDPGYRTIGAAYPVTIDAVSVLPIPYATTSPLGTCGGTIAREGMTHAIIIPVLRNITSIDPVNSVVEMRVTRWYAVKNSLAPTINNMDADEVSLVYVPVCQVYDWTVGNIVNSGLTDDVIGATGHLPDTLSAVTEVGDPDTILDSPAGTTANLPTAVRTLDMHGAVAITVELRDTPSSVDVSPEEAQVLIGFE